jgi:hypothetical protein
MVNQGAPMFSMKPGKVLPVAAACAVSFILVACGGGSDSPPTPTASDPPASPGPAPAPTPTPTPAPTPAPTPTPTPGPAPSPPTDPAPPTDIVLAPAYTELNAALALSKPHWPAWAHVGSAPVDGVGCVRGEDYHIHALVSIYQDAQRLALPDPIGRDSGCGYELHTHDGSGLVHIETDKPKVFTLGQFFALWGQPLGATAVAGLPGKPTYYVIDKEKVVRFTGDPSAITLDAHREIVIVTGTPPTQVPRYHWQTSGM